MGRRGGGQHLRAIASGVEGIGGRLCGVCCRRKPAKFIIKIGRRRGGPGHQGPKRGRCEQRNERNDFHAQPSLSVGCSQKSRERKAATWKLNSYFLCK